MIAAFLIALSLATASAEDAESAAPDIPQTYDQARQVTDSCRQLRPNGWRPYALQVVNSPYGAILCVYQPIQRIHQVRVDKVLADIEDHPPAGIAVRSFGGDAELWLDLMEAADVTEAFVIVDGWCVSSCANYAFAPARARIVPEGSIVGWHGGPTDDPAFLRDWANDLSGGGFSGDTWASILSLGARTRALYDAAGVSMEILRATHNTLPPENYIRAAAEAGNAPPRLTLQSVALSPDTLERCFGFRDLDLMTHPGDDAATMRAGWALDEALGVYAHQRSTVDGCPVQPPR